MCKFSFEFQNASSEKWQLSAGPLLCFVHADSRPPANFISLIRKTLSNGKVVMGGFRVIIEHKGRKLHWMTFHQLIKTYYAPLLFRPLSFFRSDPIHCEVTEIKKACVA